MFHYLFFYLREGREGGSEEGKEMIKVE